MAMASVLKEAQKARRKREHQQKTVSTLKEALIKIDNLELDLQALTRLKGVSGSRIIKPRKGTNQSEAVAIVSATDWHLGSTITRKQVNGLNSFSVADCKRRVYNLFDLAVRMTDKERHSVTIDELILFLGGDLIDGALHMDTIQTNEIAEPIKQAVVCQELIESGLNFLLNHGKFKKITVVCCDGNHGRITHKMHFSSRQGNALEHYMYVSLASKFPQLNWVMADGILNYVKVFDYNLRFHHGDTISFGGVNGPYTYLNRRIFTWDNACKADYSVQGHLHCYTLGTRRWLINGSLVGYSPYAIGLSGEYQPPIQAFTLLDKHRGVTVQIPLLVDR